MRHLDQPHPHCHLVYNRVGNNGQTISDKNIKIRNAKVCRELTEKYGYTSHRVKRKCVGNSCANRTRANTKSTMRSKAACPSAKTGTSWNVS
ncbi:MAG: relaxase/mobilization nuclease domain-containing protein [Alistipes finegoldii]